MAKVPGFAKAFAGRWRLATVNLARWIKQVLDVIHTRLCCGQCLAARTDINFGGWIILRELKTTKDKAELRQNNGGVKVPKERRDEIVHDHHLRAILGNLRDTPLVQARFGR